MNIEDIKNILENESLNKINLNYKYPSRHLDNTQIINRFLLEHKNFNKSEIIYLLLNKNNIENIHIFCPLCGRKNVFNNLKHGYSQYCCAKHSQKCNRDNARKTWLNRYGVDNPNKCRLIREKIENTKYKKYGYKCNWSSPDKKLNGKSKRKELYGVENCFSSKDPKLNGRLTCLNRYGYTNYTKTDDYKNLYKNNEWLSKRQVKQYKTKSINKTFNTSKAEEVLFDKLKSRFPDAIHHYSIDSRYPFECDFYIPSKDLFIELNFHWIHGKEPFNILNKNHIKILNNWKNKNTKFYKIAIEVWTKRDILKLKTFNNNKLNYKVFYNENEFNKWFNKE